MTITRRKLFGVGAVAGLTLAACGPEARERSLGDLEDLHQGSFAPEIGSMFQLVSGDHLFESLTLVKVTDLSSQSQGSAKGEAFSALFVGPEDKPLTQGVYRLEHERLGGMTLLIVPMGTTPQGPAYEAVFNRQAA